ncbi:MAG: hypothetical protein LBD72_02465 [Puniceicoccales bacterium]|nr:hypothetical protein [Puniceicoccales bacterium]
MDGFFNDAQSALYENVWRAVEQNGQLVPKGTTALAILETRLVTHQQVAKNMSRDDCLTILKCTKKTPWCGGVFHTTKALRKHVSNTIKNFLDKFS